MKLGRGGIREVEFFRPDPAVDRRRPQSDLARPRHADDARQTGA
ncbi:MAG: hypothetical protein WDN48_04285 [Pseudolabrys sp.]